MKTLRLFCCGLILSLLAAACCAQASEDFDDLTAVIKVVHDEDVILAYVQTSPSPYAPTPEEITFLKDLGVSNKVIEAIIQRGKDLQARGVKPSPVTATAPVNASPVKVESASVSIESQQNVPALATLPVVQPPMPAETTVSDPVIGHPEPVLVTTPPANTEPDAVTAPLPIVDETRQDAMPATAPETSDPITPVEPPTPIFAGNDQPMAVSQDGGANISYFYNTLSPYGEWVLIGNVWCWQPAVALTDSSWQPYCQNGHWIWTDCGWYWDSGYSWGWAAFHYGRWSRNDGYGWVWTPDCTWGPSWVNWRECDSDIGWAPLPPLTSFTAGIGIHFDGFGVSFDLNYGLSEDAYCFVPHEKFCEQNLADYKTPRTRVKNIYKNTTVINNSYTYNNSQIVNHGPSIDSVRSASSRKVNAVKLVDARQLQTQPAATSTTGATLSVYRPKINPAAPVSPLKIAASKKATLTSQPAVPVNKNNQVAVSKTQPQPLNEVRTSRPTGKPQGQAAQPQAQRPIVVAPIEQNNAVAAQKAAHEQAQREAAARQQAAQQRTAIEAAPRAKAEAAATQAREQARKQAAAQQAAQQQAKAAAAAQAREQARQQAAAQQAAQQQAKAAAAAQAREQARQQAAAQQAAQQQAKAAAATQAREQARQQAAAQQAAQQQAKAAAAAQAREQARQQAAAQQAAEQQAKAAAAAQAREQARQQAAAQQAAEQRANAAAAAQARQQATAQQAAERQAKAATAAQAREQARQQAAAQREVRQQAQDARGKNKR